MGRPSRAVIATVLLFAFGCGDEPSEPASFDAAPPVAECVEGQSDCGGSCTNLDVDSDNCGRCDLACVAAELCLAGNCEIQSGDCPDRHTTCGSECVDLSSNPAHCGGCDTACPENRVCQRGGCVDACDSNLVNCGGACIDPATHAGFCGASSDCAGPRAGEVCTAPAGSIATCTDSVCDFECGAGTVRCGDECTDVCRFGETSPGESVFQVPPGCRLVRIIVWGAGGGAGQGNNNQGAGGFAQGEVTSIPGDLWTIVVGAAGAAGGAGGAGGVPGGGNGGNGNSQNGGGGGGYSGVFRPTIAIENALVIAGGGGGSGGGSGASKTLTGAGGGVDGQDGRNGVGGTQTTGFAQLMGGPGQSGSDGGGGGGAGWFGGTGAGNANADASGGGGGSGFVTTEALASMLETGDRGTPGNAAHPLRGLAGNPGVGGKVLIECIPE